jgi:hypothetical protein
VSPALTVICPATAPLPAELAGNGCCVALSLAEQASEDDAAINAKRANERFKPTSIVDREPVTAAGEYANGAENRGTQSEKTVLR